VDEFRRFPGFGAGEFVPLVDRLLQHLGHADLGRRHRGCGLWSLPQALITTTANTANGKRKCLSDCSMDASANVLRLANDARQGWCGRIERAKITIIRNDGRGPASSLACALYPDRINPVDGICVLPPTQWSGWQPGRDHRWLAAMAPDAFTKHSSQTVRIREEHFDQALEQYFQAEKCQICHQCCPTFTPKSLLIHERKRRELAELH
jgi:hypothetical protein